MAVEPFRFMQCVYLVEPTGRRAGSLREFCDLLKVVPASSIFYHLHQSFLRHHFDLPDFTNDFSNWVATALGERALAEKLANIAPFDFERIDPDLRAHVCTVLNSYAEQHVASEHIPVAPFYFENATTLVIEGPLATDLTEFRAELATIETSSLYYHVFLTRHQNGGGRQSDEFSDWLERNFEAQPLVAALRSVDPYMHTLEELRALVLSFLDRFSGQIRPRSEARPRPDRSPGHAFPS